MGLLDMLMPISIGSTPVKDKQMTHPESAEKNQANKGGEFAGVLKQAKNNIKSGTHLPENKGSEMFSSAFNLGLGAMTGNPVLAGKSSLNLLQAMMHQGINQNFNQVGIDIGMQLMEAMAGNSNATAVKSVSNIIGSESVKQEADGVVATLAENKNKSSTQEASEPLTSTSGKRSFRKGTIPWLIEQHRLKEIIVREEKQG